MFPHILMIFLTSGALLTSAKQIEEFINQKSKKTLLGCGLVVGLEGTGGRSLATQQRGAELFSRYGSNFSSGIISSGSYRPDLTFRIGNFSLVSVTAELSPDSQIGSRIEAIVSVLDDATSLKGGTLLMTPLYGPNKKAYAVALGPLTGSSTVGQIKVGVIVEREVKEHSAIEWLQNNIKIIWPRK